MTPELSAAIDGLYVAFTPYAGRPPPPYLEAANPVGFGAHLAAKPLRRLGAADLETFKWKVLTTWGDEDDFRHYLPRMLELECDGGMGGTEVIFSRLSYAGWAAWPVVERRAVEAFCMSWWEAVIGTWPTRVATDLVLCGIGQIVDDVRPYLQRWRADQSRGEAMQLANWVRRTYGHVVGKPRRPLYPFNPWWERREAVAEQVSEWLASGDRLRELEAAFFAFGTDDETAAAALSYAFNELDHLQAARLGR